MAAKKGKKGRKIGRNQKKCEQYRIIKSVPNKIAKLRKHLRGHTEDMCAVSALERVKRSSNVTA